MRALPRGAHKGLAHITICLVCAVCRMQSVLCAGVSLCYVRDSVCVMCAIQGILDVLCAGFSLGYVRDLVRVMCGIQSVSWLRSEHALLRLVWKGPARARGRGPCWAQWKGPTRARGQNLGPPPYSLSSRHATRGVPTPPYFTLMMFNRGVEAAN